MIKNYIKSTQVDLAVVLGDISFISVNTHTVVDLKFDLTLFLMP